MTVGAVHVAVGQFFGGGIAQLNYLPGEVEVFASQRVVEIHFHLGVGHFYNHTVEAVAMGASWGSFSMMQKMPGADAPGEQ